MIHFKKDDKGNITGLGISPQNDWEKDVAMHLNNMNLLDSGVSFGDKRGKPKDKGPDILQPDIQKWLKRVEELYLSARK